MPIILVLNVTRQGKPVIHGQSVIQLGHLSSFQACMVTVEEGIADTDIKLLKSARSDIHIAFKNVGPRIKK